MKERQEKMKRGYGKKDRSGVKPIEKLEDGRLLLQVNKAIYNHKTILAAVYKFTQTCYIHVDLIDSDHYGVFFTAKNPDIDFDFQVNNFCNELIDQQIRYGLDQSYRSIKELIIRKAFFPFEANE
jgi:His-Xaa-Ser system protein HxsD